VRKINNSTHISLDGVVELPHEQPTIERPSDERSGEVQTSLLLACDAVLTGRRTYESFARPSRPNIHEADESPPGHGPCA
jgi:hypothetical protein